MVDGDDGLNPDPDADALASTLALYGTLSTLAHTWHAIRERRAGRDPSAQEEPAFARLWLADAAPELHRLSMQIQAGRVVPTADDAEARAVRRFEELVALADLARLLHRVHQRLLSLYPEVDDALVERARLLQYSAAACLDDDEADVLAAVQGVATFARALDTV